MRRLLVANRGEIARRVMRTAQRMGIETVAVFSDADARALFVREATFSFALGGDASSESYLRIDKLLAAARASGADAVHPGYGFLSENADFAQAVIDAGLLWIGPPPSAITALGSKSNAKQLALKQGVPCLDGYQGADQSDERFALEAQRIGYPVMVKASAGGGGRGMRLVLAAAQLPAALSGARSEARSSFGSAELLIECALLAPRHVEVQVFADRHGHCIHLGERDCSVQRRHQKIIEESPSPAVDATLRERMGRFAVQLALGAGYEGAGTVEFLLEGGAFYLMEMNTRLQVEHPVTEMLSGLDLVEWQLRVARGEPLPLRQEQVVLQGHAIEVRLCAEDENFAPHAGQVLRFDEPPSAQSFAPLEQSSSPLRFDHALFPGAQVPPHYDSMLGKLIAFGPTRLEAMARLRAALAQTCVLGLPTNRALLEACLAHPQFAAGGARIPFLAEQGDALRATLRLQEERLLLPCALALFYADVKAPAMALPCAFARPLRLRWRGQTHDVVVTELGLGRLRVEHAGRQHEVMLCAGEDATLRVTLDGATHRVFAARLPDGRWHMQCDGVDLWLQDASFEPAARPGQAHAADGLRAPFNGRLLVLHAVGGVLVRRGDALAVIESMKLEHVLCAPRDGTIQQVLVLAGQQVATGQLLMSLEPT
jgi:geranyl-CoA carboxylase alpha subunit